MQDDVGSLNAKQNMIPPNYGRCCKAASASVGLITLLFTSDVFHHATSLADIEKLYFPNKLVFSRWNVRSSGVLDYR